MTRVIGLLLLIAFALTIPCANICVVSTDDGDTIAMLDICNHGAPGTSNSLTTLTEPAFDLQTTLHFTDLPNEKPFIYESAVFSPADRPPTV